LVDRVSLSDGSTTQVIVALVAMLAVGRPGVLAM